MRGTPAPLPCDAAITVRAGHTGHGFHCVWPGASQHHRLGGCGRGEADPREWRPSQWEVMALPQRNNRMSSGPFLHNLLPKLGFPIHCPHFRPDAT